MAMVKTSPLHRVIDSGRWDAERLLGRFIIVVHAAFLDAGFVPHPDGAAAKAPKPRRVPKQVGATASTLSLRYAVPQLLHQDAGAAALRMCAHGRHVVFYVCMRSVEPRRPGTYWVCLDVLAAAPLLSGGLDDTARALRRDARVAALWGALADGMCRRVLVDLCRENGVVLSPTFMSLPDDAQAAILARVDDGEDLLTVARTCTELRRLVADRDRELWKPRYEALGHMRMLRRGGGDSPEMTWKEMYLRATRRPAYLTTWAWNEMYRINLRYWLSSQLLPDDIPPRYDPFSLFDFHDLCDPPELPVDAATGRRQTRVDARGKSAASNRRAMASGGGREKRRDHGAGVIHSPSSRYRWKHR